eukprot:4543233-Karenia_brevis.AAC.1
MQRDLEADHVEPDALPASLFTVVAYVNHQGASLTEGNEFHSRISIRNVNDIVIEMSIISFGIFQRAT